MNTDPPKRLKLPPPRPRDPASETPLTGIRVVDFSHFIAGPFATMMLADFGADVIKIESAGEGDGFRNYPPSLDGESIPYLWVNRNKRSVALDLKSASGRALALRLADAADVVVENFSTGVMRRLGLDYETLRTRNPRLIYCSISSYGRDGPFAHRVGFDPIVQAESGFMAMNGFPDREPVRAGPSIMDVSTALMSCSAMLAAVVARQRTGRGQYIETTMIETAVNMLGNFSLAYLATGLSPSRFGHSQPTASPVGYFETADGPLYLACANDRTFRRLAIDVLGTPGLASDPRFVDSAARRDNQRELLGLIADALRHEPRAALLARMHAAGVPAGAVRTVGEALGSHEIAELGLLSEIPHATLGSVPNVGLPIHLSDTPLADPVGAPPLGADTVAVLRELLGCTDAELSELSDAGAFGASPPAVASEQPGASTQRGGAR